MIYTAISRRLTLRRRWDLRQIDRCLSQCFASRSSYQALIRKRCFSLSPTASTSDTERTPPEDPSKSWVIDEALAPYIRACVGGLNPGNYLPSLAKDTGISICTLGTGSGTGSKNRNNSATALRNMGFCYLVDAGEGIQRQFLWSRMNIRDIRKIFITHMHGDHVFGLPGLILFLQVANMNSNHPRNIEIYGPVGLFNYLASSLSLSGTEIKKIKVDVFELDGGTQRSKRSAANRKNFPEFRQRGITRHSIPQNADGTFTLSEPIEITTRELANRVNKPVGLLVKAAELDHVPRLQCFGYMFQEPFTQPRSIDAQKAKSLGITDHDDMRELKCGFSVKVGDREVHPDEVCGPPPRPRKVTILGDCTMVPPAMARLALDSDVLVHEATLNVNDKGRKVTLGGHSSAAEAALAANKCRAKVLLMNHFSPRVDLEGGVEACLEEAKQFINADQTKVQVAYDHLELLIPRNGFCLNEKLPSPPNEVKSESEAASL